MTGWLDMSVYPDDDPGPDGGLLRDALAVAPGALDDATWDRLLADALSGEDLDGHETDEDVLDAHHDEARTV